jgi:hypothetical protein
MAGKNVRWLRRTLLIVLTVGACIALVPPSNAMAAVLGPYWWAALHSGKCMDVTAESNANNAPIQQWTCVSDGNGMKGNQMWYSDATVVGSFTLWTLRNEKSGKCMDGFLGPNVQVTQWNCDGTNAQKWIPTSTNTGIYKYENYAFRGYCLDVRGASTADGASVDLYACTSGNNQRWR